MICVPKNSVLDLVLKATIKNMVTVQILVFMSSKFKSLPKKKINKYSSQGKSVHSISVRSKRQGDQMCSRCLFSASAINIIS
jgi:hypothetical protein